MSSGFPPGKRLFNLWVWFSYRHGWLGSSIRWWMIWAHLIFPDLSCFLCHTGAYSSFWLGFVDSPLICMIIPGYEIHIGLMIRFHCVLILCGASLEPFSQIHVFWYSRDSWTELSQARGFPRPHFRGFMLDPLYVPMELSLSHQDRSGTSDTILGRILLI